MTKSLEFPSTSELIAINTDNYPLTRNLILTKRLVFLHKEILTVSLHSCKHILVPMLTLVKVGIKVAETSVIKDGKEHRLFLKFGVGSNKVSCPLVNLGDVPLGFITHFISHRDTIRHKFPLSGLTAIVVIFLYHRLRAFDISCNFVTIVEVMGRNAGWLTAASALARGEDCDGPDLIYLPEVPFDLAAFRKKVDDLLDIKNNLMIAVSEGIHDADGTYICEYVSTEKLVDAFGHKQMGGTASYLCSYCEAEFGCKTRAIEFSTLQRCAAHFASQTDVNEVFQSGDKAVEAALSGRTGLMATLLRANDEPYVCEIGLADVHHISNVERLVPLEWITEDGSQISDDFIRYALPLIQGESQPVIEDGLPKHLVLK